MHYIRCLILLVLTAITLFPLHANADFRLTFLEPQNGIEERIKNKLKRANRVIDALRALNRSIPNLGDIDIIFGGEEPPYYFDGRIHIPYWLLDYFRNIFNDNNYRHNRGSTDNIVYDVLIHTLFHEVGHAVIERRELPIVGRIEDAADSFAYFFILNQLKDGPDILKTTADAFLLDGGNRRRFSKEELSGYHSLDIQRYYTTLCFIYGYDPKKYRSVVEGIDMDEERLNFCPNEFHYTAVSWSRLLELN